MPRSERPIRRWISTVRPSARPFDTSRCLRSPVEAGSIPYSAVTQPRPFPISQRGTDSTAEAVQITRVPPAAMSAEPVAVRTKPGLDRDRAKLVRGAAVVPHAALRIPSGATSTWRTSPSGSCRKRVPIRLNDSGSPEQRKPVDAPARGVVLEPGLGEDRLHVVGDRLAGADDLDPRGPSLAGLIGRTSG